MVLNIIKFLHPGHQKPLSCFTQQTCQKVKIRQFNSENLIQFDTYAECRGAVSLDSSSQSALGRLALHLQGLR